MDDREREQRREEEALEAAIASADMDDLIEKHPLSAAARRDDERASGREPERDSLRMPAFPWTAARRLSHGERIRTFAERYFAAWPEQKNAVNASHDREAAAILADTGFNIRDVTRTLDESILASPDANTITAFPDEMVEAVKSADPTSSSVGWQRLLAWYITDSRLEGGPLGSAFRESLIPTFTFAEIEAFEDKSSDELRAFPPVFVGEIRSQNEESHLTSAVFARYGAGLIGSDVIAREKMPLPLRELFASVLNSAWSDLNADEHTGIAESQPARDAFRRFAVEFYDWYSTQPAHVSERSPLRRLFHSVNLPILTNSPAMTALESMIVDDKQKEWQRLYSERSPTYGDPKGTYVTIGDPRPDAGPLTLEQQKASADTVLSLNDEHAQTFVFLMAHWMVQNDGQKVLQRARVHVNDVLDFRELERKKRDFKPEQKREERDRILRLSQMWVRVLEKVAPRGKSRKTKLVNVYSRLIELSIETEADTVGMPIPMLLDGFPTESIPYAFRFGPGEWISSYWGDAAQIGTIFRKVLTYDTQNRAERIAMRIALYLSFVPLRSETTSVESVFVGAHIPPPKVQPLRWREAFDDALGKLRDDGIISGYEYVDGVPASSGKGWSAKWLSAKIRIYAARESASNSIRPAAAPPELSV